MPNLRVISDNAIDRATLTSPSTAANFTTAAIKLGRKSDVWRAAGTTARLSATWPTAETIQAVALPFCNLSPTEVMRVRTTSEAQATNLLTNTSSGASMLSNGDTGTAVDIGTAPDGTATVIRISSGTRYRTASGLVPGASYTYSEFVRSAGGSSATLFKDGGLPTASSVFTFSNATATGAGSTVKSIGGGWFRVSMTFVAQAATGSFHYMPGGGAVDFWGAQLEVGTVPTSYYPSAGAPATRPLGYIDSWQSYDYDSGFVLACPAPARRVRGFAAWQAASAYAFGGGADAVHWMPAARQAVGLAVDIVHPDNLQGYIEASFLVAGPYWEADTNPEYGASVTLVDSTKNGRTDAGDLISDAGTMSKKLSLPMSFMGPADQTALWNILRSGGTRYPLFVSLFPGHADLELERKFQVYGKFVQMPSMALPRFNIASATVEIESIDAAHSTIQNQGRPERLFLCPERTNMLDQPHTRDGPVKRGGFITVRLTSRWPYNPFSLAVGLASGSHQFSHAFAIIGNRAYESSMTHGCRAGAEADLMKGIIIYRDMRVWVPDLDAAIAFAEAQIGKGYDWLGAIGIPFTYSEDWADDSRWWCSELVFAIILAGGTKLFDPDVATRVRPIDLHMYDSPKTATMYA